MKQLISIIFLFFSLQGCIITRTPGFYSGYNRLSEEDQSFIVFLNPDSNICKLSNNGFIYSVTGTQLLECIKTNKNILIYFWSPNCKSEYCFSLQFMQDYCIKKGYILYVVSVYYNSERMLIEKDDLIATPLLSINERYYGTRYCNKYQRLFLNDLLKGQVINNEKDLFSNVYIFNNGYLISNTFDKDILEIKNEFIRK